MIRGSHFERAHAICDCCSRGSPHAFGGAGAGPDGGRDRREGRRGPGRAGEDRGGQVGSGDRKGRLRRGGVRDRGGLRGAAETAGHDPQRDHSSGPDCRRGFRRAGGVEPFAVPGQTGRAEGIRGRRARFRAARGHRGAARPLAREGAQSRVPGDRGRGRHAGAQVARFFEGRRYEVHLPRSGLLSRDPRRDGRPGPRRRANRRGGPRQLRAGRGSLLPVFGRGGAKGRPEELARHDRASRGECRGGRRALQVPAGGNADRTRHPGGRGRRGSLRFSRPAARAIRRAGVLSALPARNIGSATMSGRVSAVAAKNLDGKTTLFVGAASGGVWKSEDGGTRVKPVFDKQPVQSIGAVTIDPSNPKTVWVGTGESWMRNSVSVGDGIYKSTDGGETWTNTGLSHSEHIVRIVVHPKDGDTVYACAPGKLWSDSAERGLYKTADGGKTWSLALKGANLSTGCASLAMDPKNPDHLFAGMWDFRRKGWTFSSGGEGPDAPSGSGLFESQDGGKTWSELTDKTRASLPAKPWGRVEVAVAPSDPKIVYALVESGKSALYRSADGGKTWEARDRSPGMVWRPFYFGRLVVDPGNADRIFKPGGGLVVSDDGGRSFAGAGGGAHGDWHDVWVDPDNSKHVIGGDDGGLWISYDGGNRWWKSNNLPISQFYHVAVDARDPYQVYGGLQDNSSWVGDSSYPGGITNSRAVVLQSAV